MDWNSPDTVALVTAFQHSRSYEATRRLLSDLLTEEEIALLSRRFHAADMLNESIPYALISRETGLSSATIAKIAKKLRGTEGGYIVALERIAPLPPPRRRALS